MVALVLAGCLEAADPPPVPVEPAPAPPPVKWEALRLQTDIGPITLILYPEAAPLTVAYLRRLVDEGYYSGREFTRVVPGHVIQVADKAGGATDDLRTVPLEVKPGYHFAAGAAGIARGQDPNSGGPEFFLMDFATSHLDGSFTLWGQVVDGLGLVHRAARVEAVQTGDVPAANLLLTDRTAINPVKILRADLVRLDLPHEASARYPLRVALNEREGNFRHSLEWPADLRAGAQARLVWYVRPYEEEAVPDPGRVLVEVDGQRRPVLGDPDAGGVYAWTWTPSTSGVHSATFLEDGRPRQSLQILVPA